ncbi:MAG: hypothetical protein HLUCCO02_11665 [Idiomarinaceae bacterium HL-53]|nr:MAG: hypothetical protein HLUCCO02_11665 [Idiomarinaceae bacterium HL-53]
MSLAGSDDMLEILPFVAFFAYMLTVFIALPLYGVMRYKKWLTWGHFALFGALLGMGAGVAFWAIAHRNNALIASTIFSPPSKP